MVKSNRFTLTEERLDGTIIRRYQDILPSEVERILSVAAPDASLSGTGRVVDFMIDTLIAGGAPSILIEWGGKLFRVEEYQQW